MRYSVPAALLSLVIPLVHAAPAVILEETKGIPPGWVFLRNASASDRMTLFVALKEPGIEELKAKFSQRRDVDHPSFGQHLSRDEVAQYRQPGEQSSRAVLGWLRSEGIRNMHNQGSLISFEASAQTVKTLFHAELGYYAYEESNAAPVLRAQSYTIPAWLRDYIDFVHPISSFMPPRPRPRPHPKPTKKPFSMITSTTTTTTTRSTTSAISSSSSSSSSSITLAPKPTPDIPDNMINPFPDLPCLAATVPDCIKKLYNISYSPSPPGSPSPVRFGVAGFLEQWVLHSDVDLFLDTLAPTLPRRTNDDDKNSHNFTVELVNDGTNPQDSPRNAGLEASLDVEYAMALGYPANVVFYSTGGRGAMLDAGTGLALPASQSDNEPFLELLQALLAKPDGELPHVLSISYADDEVGVPRAYARRVCDQFAALAARGTTVLAATGDGGAAGTGRTQCVDRETGARRFVATFPAGCPYVTAVGAVSNVGPPVAGAAYSSGGFSDFFGRPAWQDEAVEPYLAALVRGNDTRIGLFNHGGRAVPDISAVGSAFQIVLGGDNSQVLGTSASTPVVAAMVALINDARMRAGKPSLGWLNPLLYSAKVRNVLRDVTVGESMGCRFPDGVRSVGWSAVRGYDLVTGLGVVDDFNDFLEALL
ncbi:subtilisin-like protein [Thermothelomyces heterothallicus CBS 203.75]